MPRAILFASAIVTTGTGLRSSIRVCQGRFDALVRRAQRITAVAPVDAPAFVGMQMITAILAMW